MLSNEEFVRQSLELNLVFLRIMKEHAIFIQGGLTPKDQALAVQAEQFKNQFTGLLSEVVNLSSGKISPEVVASVVAILTDQATPRSASRYWAVLKKRLIEEGAELLTNCKQLKMTAADGKKRLTDVANFEKASFLTKLSNLIKHLRFEIGIICIYDRLKCENNIVARRLEHDIVGG